MWSWPWGPLQTEEAMLVLALLLEHLGKRSPFSPRKSKAGRIISPEMLMTIMSP